MAIHVHRAERTDRLAEALGELLSLPPTDPFSRDLVAVPTPGIERFLTQTLGRRLGTSGVADRVDGVCANVAFPSPAGLVEAVLSGGPDGSVRPEEDPWRPARSVWPLLCVIDESVHESWCRPLARHLGLGIEHEDGWDRSHRRFAVASRLARLFQSYGSQRPALILEWVGGADTDGAGGAVDGDQAWQPVLWRRLRARIGQASPAERLEAACRAVESDPGLVDLPDRLSVFGPSRLPADQLRALQALARGREVHLWLADASPVLWTKLAGEQAPVLRAGDTGIALVDHPLLRSLGRDARELGLRLTPLVEKDGSDQHLARSTPAGQTLLERLQADLTADRRPLADPANPLEPGDTSVQVHGCHGPARQVEVLRESILTLLQDDPTLQPRDILVMCPDLAGFAPLLAAAFTATGPGTPLADLRIRIADRSPEQDNEVLTTLGVVLDLVTGRMLRSELLDLMSRAPVRTRLRLTDDHVERLEQLAVAVGVRWGLDGRTRHDHGLAGIDVGTWSWALDRLLLGVALSEDELPIVGDVLPYDDVSANDVTLLGALAEVVGRLAVLRDVAAVRAPLPTWVALLSETVTALMDARGADSWQVPHALAALAGLTRTAGELEGQAGPDLSLADIRWLMADVLAGRPTRSNFRSGGLTVCGLLPMRSVPHRVVCLVGLDDGDFPRSPVPDGDDVLARRPCLGERDPRSEDRQVLLDAIMAATDHLVITYTAADDRTNAPSPPCVPLGELLDALDATAVLPDGGTARTQVVRLHPLQPFDHRNFIPDQPAGEPFSHDDAALAGAVAALRPRVPRPALTESDPLPAEPVKSVEIGELTGFLAAPPAWFLRKRIGVTATRPQDLPSESLPVDLDGLGRWALGDRIVDLIGRAGHGTATIAKAERARGDLPPGQLGTVALNEVGPLASAVAEAVTAAQAGLPARLVTVSLALDSGRTVLGSVGRVHGTTLVRGTYSKADARQLIRLWPALLAVAAGEPGPCSAIVVGKDEALWMAAPTAKRAKQILDELLDLVQSGYASPLPLYTKTSYTYAKRRREGKSEEIALMLADRIWASGQFPGESANPEAVALFGPNAPISQLVSPSPLPGEAWFADEPKRFGQLSRRLWDPILEAVERGAAERLAARAEAVS
jgi:exodeoxyribonuclease V gamma subunit